MDKLLYCNHSKHIILNCPLLENQNNIFGKLMLGSMLMRRLYKYDVMLSITQTVYTYPHTFTKNLDKVG